MGHALRHPDTAFRQESVTKELPRIFETVLLMGPHIRVTDKVCLVPPRDDLVEIGVQEVSNGGHAFELAFMFASVAYR